MVDKLKTPFVGTRVSASATQEGYFEDAMVIGVVCGDFDVNVFHEKINFENPEETANRMISTLGDPNLCFIHTASHYKQNVIMDGILRRIQTSRPHMQIIGGASSPPAIIAVKDGVYSDYIIVAALKGEDTDFKILTACKIDEASKEEFTITKADEYHIYEINGRDAVEEYSKIQHIRPYFLNMITNYVLNRADILKVVKALGKASGTIYDGLLSLGINLIGAKNRDGVVEPALLLELNESGRRYALIQHYMPEGTVLRRVKHSSEEGKKAFDALAEYSKDKKAMYVIVCAAIFWVYIDFKDLKKRLQKIQSTYMLSFVFGEYGATLPYNGPEQNVVNGATIKALAFK
jgi:hypothetical protein